MNGQAWIPKDNYGQATFKLDADPTFQEGLFGVTAFKYYASGKFQQISIGSDSCTKSGSYLLGKPRNRAQFLDVGVPIMLMSGDSEISCTGVLNIARYDLQNRVFSGTFEFLMYNNAGDTVKITNGRFDKKL